MRSSVWICTLSVVLILIQRQFMTVSAADTCPRLEIPRGAILINPSCNNTYGSKCVFICQSGFAMIGKEGNVTRTCLQFGNWSGNNIKCSERRKPTTDYRASEKLPLSVIIVIGFSILIFIIIIAVAIFLLRIQRPLRRNAPTPRFDLENVDVDAAFDNPSYCRNGSFPDSERQPKVMASPQPEQEPDAAFSNLYIDPGDHCVTLNNIEKEVIPLDSSNCNSETLHGHLSSSLPKYITKVEATFSNSGGELSAPLESDVRIIVPSGAISSETNQNIFFGVFSDETILLRDIPEAPDKTLISPVVECGPHNIHLSKPVEIIVPHCLCLSDAQIEMITVYRCGHFLSQGQLNWEKVPNEAEKSSQSQAVFTVKKDAIHIKTETFSLWSIFACGGPRRKRATVFSNRPDPKGDLIYMRFYVYSDNTDSKRRVELAEKRFPGSRPTREKPFTMYKDTGVITVKLTDLAEGWNSNKPDDTQIYKYEKARRGGFRCQDACDFAVKPEDGRDVDAFSCTVKFQPEGDDEEHLFDVHPGFTPLKRQSIWRNSTAGRQSVTASSNNYAIAGCSTSTGPQEEQEDFDSHNQEGRSSPDSSRDNGYVQFDQVFASLGLGTDKPVTENLLYGISPYVGVKWKPVLRKLSIKEAIIRNLEEDYKNASVDEKCYQGLLAWKDGQGPQGATIKTLCDALRVVGCSEALIALQREIVP